MQNYTASDINNGYFQFDQNDFRKESIIDSYNQFDRITQSHKVDDMNTSYFWGYNNQFQVIVAHNLDYSSLESAVNSINNDFETFLFSLGDLTDPLKRVEWSTFNTSLRAALPQGARIITYTYLPLVGMTSKTDQNGISTYYYYDEFGRLKFEKDYNSNIVKKYDYHYAGQ